ncbi:MAG: DUF899 family protein [Verrucomicrobia bacterium]|nr:DUF899 family protein [Verrucomicrobiota bacterium]
MDADNGDCVLWLNRVSHPGRGWNFKWVSSANNDFNYDYHVSFGPGAPKGEAEYHYAGLAEFVERNDLPEGDTSDLPGVSVF